ncbi:MAG TPA: DUF4402 domain-containing protein [Saprospiraceae bacterium]|nr:DUF4402 domain-containing protein [Saprospiraceae bacterium]
MYKFLMIPIALIGFTINATGQSSANATASASIVAPIAIVQVANMNFGNVAVTDVAGTVILATDGSRSITGGVTLPATSGTVSAAEFTVTGEAGYTYDITVPSSHTITKVAGAETMTVDAFVSDPTELAGVLTGGTQTLLIGATLNVAALQVAGTYTNAIGFEVTVNYN